MYIVACRQECESEIYVQCSTAAAYMCFSEGSLSRTLTFAFLERVKEEFSKKYKDKAASATASSLTQEYG